VTYATGDYPYFAEIGDINGDNKPDIVTANYFGHSISVLLGKGDGTFKPKVDFPTSEAPHRLRLVDVNRDGRLDVVTGDIGNLGCQTHVNRMSVLINTSK
jgi:hypothetical protein